ncbi:MAG: helix-turn-helix domain-containing protein [Candidatus Moranbacteria bacterium]|nr:helix-turn-helix domain-containing protein [Candidatus Moranbacteria bacterium]
MEENNNIYNVLYNPLKELGLSDLEIETYIISLKMGASSISGIAKHLNIARPNVYKIIKRLEEKGLAKFSDKKKYSRNFFVEPPSLVLEKFREKKQEYSQKENALVSAMPSLLANYQQGEMPTKIKIFHGNDDFRKIFFNILEEANGKIWFCGSVQDFIGFISWADEKKWIKERLEKKLFINALLLPSKDAETLKETDEKELRETRLLKGFFPFQTSFQLFGNKVIFWQPLAPLAIVIEDKYLVEMMESIVDKLWENAKES